MAVDMFIDIKGIKGESRDKVHRDKIDVLSWSWGASQSGTTHMGGGGGSGKANFQDLSFTKYVDKASCDLMLCCANGKHTEEATLLVRKAGENPLEYIKLEMKNVIITSISTGGSGGEDRLTENVSLNFAKVKISYIEQTQKGGTGAKPSMGWDIACNEKW